MLSGPLLRVYDMPVVRVKRGKTEKRRIDAMGLQLLLERLALLEPGCIYIEDVGGMPGQSAPNAFAFGYGCGQLLQAAASLRLPVQMVSPQLWKRALKVPAGKDDARARASQLLPAHAELWARGKDDGRAEAALIALWGLRSLQGLTPATSPASPESCARKTQQTGRRR